jgi:hypothetical protein
MLKSSRRRFPHLGWHVEVIEDSSGKMTTSYGLYRGRREVVRDGVAAVMLKGQS